MKNMEKLDIKDYYVITDAVRNDKQLDGYTKEALIKKLKAMVKGKYD